jgi:BR serine/threonine kinase
VSVDPLRNSRIPVRQAATKIIKKTFSSDHPELLQKVQREISLVQLCDSRCFWALHDVDGSDHHIFIVDAPNGSLSDCIQLLATLPAISFFRQIICGLDYLHQHGVCHQDLKPENALSSAANQLFISDFGLGCWIANSIANGSCGAAMYSVAEIICGVPCDGRMSGTGVRASFCAMFTATFRFLGDSVRALAQRIKKGTSTIRRTGF